MVCLSLSNLDYLASTAKRLQEYDFGAGEYSHTFTLRLNSVLVATINIDSQNKNQSTVKIEVVGATGPQGIEGNRGS